MKVQIWEVEEGVERISRFLAEMTKWKEVSFIEMSFLKTEERNYDEGELQGFCFEYVKF